MHAADSGALSGPLSMRTISSPTTSLTKRMAPIAWMGFWSILCLAGVVMLLPETVIGSAVMLALGYFIFSWNSWSLADEVVDCGTYLQVTRGDAREDIDLTRIAKVTYVTPRLGSSRVFLRLRSPCAFGTVIRFIPDVDFWTMSLSPVGKFVGDLEQRIQDERQKKLDAYRDQARQAVSGGDGEQGV